MMADQSVTSKDGVLTEFRRTLSERVSSICTKKVQSGDLLSLCNLLHSNEITSEKGVMMLRQQIFDELNQRLKDVFEHSPAKDLEKNLRAMLQSMFSRLDLVTREEFDVQSEVLKRTREKLDQLEARVAQLEGRPIAEQYGPAAPAQGSEI